MLAEPTIDMGAAACAVIDDALHRFGGRTLVSGSEVVDLLLDLRIAIDAETRVAALLAPARS